MYSLAAYHIDDEVNKEIEDWIENACEFEVLKIDELSAFPEELGRVGLDGPQSTGYRQAATVDERIADDVQIEDVFDDEPVRFSVKENFASVVGN